MSAVGEKRKHHEENMNCVKKNGTTCCNVKVSFLRPNYNNLKEWMNDERNLYIGRAGVVFVDGQRFPKRQTVWANPFKVGKDGKIHTVLQKFESHIREKMKLEPTEYDIETLRGLNLGCWCVPSTISAESEAPEVCHGQVLMRLLSETDKDA